MARTRTPRDAAKRGADRVKVEISAGGIVFKRTPKGVRLAFIMDPYGKWAFAKGHVEQGETVEDAALRETREEMGLRKLRTVRELGVIDFWFRDRYRAETRGVLVHKYVHYFLMQTPAGAYGKTQKTEKIRRTIWVPLGKAMSTSSYDDVRPIMEKVLEHFSRESRRGPPRATAAARPPAERGGELPAGDLQL